jgi:hypothetical protein
VTGIRRILGLLVLVASLSGALSSAQDSASGNSGIEPVENGLKLTIVGDMTMATGGRGGFRIYEAADGTTARASYSGFPSLPKAEEEIKQWLKPEYKVASKEQTKGLDGRVTGVRILAVTREAKSGNEIFLIIKRNGLGC